MRKVKEIWELLRVKYKNYFPADLWAFLIFIIVFIAGVLLIW